jgi:hypothetical protein
MKKRRTARRAKRVVVVSGKNLKVTRRTLKKK